MRRAETFAPANTFRSHVFMPQIAFDLLQIALNLSFIMGFWHMQKQIRVLKALVCSDPDVHEGSS